MLEEAQKKPKRWVNVCHSKPDQTSPNHTSETKSLILMNKFIHLYLTITITITQYKLNYYIPHYKLALEFKL